MISPSCNQWESNESWGTGISWVARYHRWRQDAYRAVIPISDELPCEGNSSSSFEEDEASLVLAIEDAQNRGLQVFPFYGTLSGGDAHTLVPSFMDRLAFHTKGKLGSLTSQGDGALARVFAAIEGAAEVSQKGILLSCAMPDKESALIVQTPGQKEERIPLPSLRKDIDDTKLPQCKELPPCAKKTSTEAPLPRKPQLRCEDE